MTAILRISSAMVALLCLVASPSLEAAGRDGAQIAGERAATGVITSLAGGPLLGSLNGTTRDLALGNTVSLAEELHTGPDGTLEILWARRTLILIRPQSTVLIHESKAGQTEIALSGGSVRVALAYHGDPNDMVTVQTPSSHVYTRGGILEVDVFSPPPSVLSRVASVFSKAEAPLSPASLETVRVLEGESGIEPVTSSGQSHMVEAGFQARIAGGMVEQMTELPKQSANGVGLTDTDRRQGTPAPLTQRLVNVHITHAVEVARLMSTPGPVGDQSATATGSDLNGTIVATSLSVPTIPPPQSGTPNGLAPGRQPSPSSPVAPAPSPGVTSTVPTLPPVAIPPVARPVLNPRGPNRQVLKEGFDDDDKRGGKHKYKGNDHNREYSGPVTSPIPMLPAVHAASMATRASGQSRGVTNRDVLKDAFDDDDKGGRQKHQGNDRDQEFSGPVTSPLPTLPAVQVSTMTRGGAGHLGGVNNRDILKDAFDDNDKGGRQKHQGNDRDQEFSGPVTSPLPALPAVQVPTIMTLAPGQSGGNNSRDLLKEILDDHDRGGGRHEGRDRGRDD
ncbi:MAG: hypothetical protein HXY51_07630 [Nitrospirae bacterium]|nr:hypothetical protein [Nitrospirota bacterium]